jgi:hypothetical protein
MEFVVYRLSIIGMRRGGPNQRKNERYWPDRDRLDGIEKRKSDALKKVDEQRQALVEAEREAAMVHRQTRSRTKDNTRPIRPFPRKQMEWSESAHDMTNFLQRDISKTIDTIKQLEHSFNELRIRYTYLSRNGYFETVKNLKQSQIDACGAFFKRLNTIMYTGVQIGNNGVSSLRVCLYRMTDQYNELDRLQVKSRGVSNRNEQVDEYTYHSGGIKKRKDMHPGNRGRGSHIYRNINPEKPGPRKPGERGRDHDNTRQEAVFIYARDQYNACKGIIEHLTRPMDNIHWAYELSFIHDQTLGQRWQECMQQYDELWPLLYN